jgi:hypothetical protein
MMTFEPKLSDLEPEQIMEKVASNNLHHSLQVLHKEIAQLRTELKEGLEKIKECIERENCLEETERPTSKED